MAIDPRISLGVKSLDVGGAINNALLNAQRIQGIQQSKAEAPFRNQLLGVQVAGAEQQASQARDINRLTNIAQASLELQGPLQRAVQTGDISQAENFLSSRIKDVQTRQAAGEDIDATESIEALTQLRTQGPQSLLNTTNDVIGAATQRGLLKPLGGGGGLASAKTEILADGSVVQALPNGEVQVRNPAGQIVTGQARLDALSTSRQTAITQRQLESDIKVAAEGSKVKAVAEATAGSANLIAKTRSFINSEVKLAEKAATEKGEVLTDLSRAEAALPGLTDVVSKLRELAPIATSTFGGRVYDTAVKELGFGATKGATASAKFGAMVNNQVLPLLKPTFGAAFTVEEGKALRATMGDVDASVDEKLAALDAFMEQKQRDIEGKQRQLEQAPAQDFDLEFDPATGTFK